MARVGSGEWIEEQYKKARWREIQKQAKEGGLKWRQENNRLRPGDPGYTGTFGTLPEGYNLNGGRTPNSGDGGAAAAAARAAASARAAEARAIARENEAKRKAGQRSLAQAANLEAQAKALRHALDVSFGKARDQNLKDLDLILGEQIDALKTGFKERLRGFEGVAADNSKAAADVQESSFSNLVREQQDTMAGLLSQGAGETDALRALVIAARNWHANAADANRNYFDTARSVDNGITDLALDTRTGLSNAFRSSEAERERTWQDFYNRRSETFTNLGNLRQQQADYYAQAEEMGVKPPVALDTRRSQAGSLYMDAAKEAGKSYVQKGLPEWMKKFDAEERPEMRQANTDLAAAIRFEPIQQAEGATLRRWT